MVYATLWLGGGQSVVAAAEENGNDFEQSSAARTMESIIGVGIKVYPAFRALKSREHGAPLRAVALSFVPWRAIGSRLLCLGSLLKRLCAVVSPDHGEPSTGLCQLLIGVVEDGKIVCCAWSRVLRNHHQFFLLDRRLCPFPEFP